MNQNDIDRLVDKVTVEILRRLGGQPDVPEKHGPKRILVLGKDSACPVAACLNRDFTAEVDHSLDRRGEFDLVVMPTWYVDKLTGSAKPADASGGNTLDLRGQRLLHERELRERCGAALKTVRIGKNTVVTPLAGDYIKQRGLTMLRED